MKHKELAKNVITAYLSKNGDFTTDGFLVMYEINSGNDELLLEHIKALRNIFDNAIKEMEGDNNGCNDESGRVD